MLPLNSWTHIIHFHSVQNIILPSDHLHMHQTVIISIMIMRPLPHIRSKEHLGVIRCKALQKKCLIWSDTHLTSQYYTWFHITVVFLPTLPHHFLGRVHFSFTSYPSLVIPQSLRKNNAIHRVCCFNLPPVTPCVLIPLSNVYRLLDMRGEAEEQETEWVIQTETKRGKWDIAIESDEKGSLQVWRTHVSLRGKTLLY